MPFDSDSAFELELEHLVRLAQIPGWKEYVWDKAKKMAKQKIYAGIDQRLVYEMKRLNARSTD